MSVWIRCIYHLESFAGGHFRVLSRSTGRLWRRDCGAKRTRPHVREEDRLCDVKAVEEMLRQVGKNAFMIRIPTASQPYLTLGLYMLFADADNRTDAGC